MAYKDKEAELAYHRKYYLEKKKPKYIPHPRIKQTKEDKLEKKREWYSKNIEKCRLQAKVSREKHKEQRKLDHKLWVEQNKDYVKEYHKTYNPKWYQKNKSTHDERGKIWAKNNPEKKKEISKRFIKNNPEKIKNYFVKYEKQNKARFRMVKHSAKKREYEFALSSKQFDEIISKPCAYCGEEKERMGIDRIDNTKGYTLENSTACCTNCNMMKKAMTVNDFLSHIKKIQTYQNIIN